MILFLFFTSNQLLQAIDMRELYLWIDAQLKFT